MSSNQKLCTFLTGWVRTYTQHAPVEGLSYACTGVLL